MDIGSSPSMTDPGGSNFVTIDVLKDRCKEHRREFSAKEEEWTSVSKHSPYFILCGLENLLYAEAYWHVAELYEDGQTDGYTRMMFFMGVALLLCLVSHTYTSRSLSHISSAWAVLDLALILAASACCVFANMQLGYWWATGVAIELLYVCHLVKHVCQAVKLHLAFNARSRREQVEDDMDQKLQRVARTDSLSESDVESGTLDNGCQIQSRPRVLHRAMRSSVFASVAIVSVTWVAAGIHELICGPAAWRGCIYDPSDPERCEKFYAQVEGVNGWTQASDLKAQLQGGRRRLETQQRGLTGPRVASAPSAEQATPRSGSGLILVALNYSGERKLVRHLGSTLIGDLVKLHHRSSLQLGGSSTVFDSQGVELGDDVSLMAAVQSGGALTEGTLDLFIN
jgi:hypothetical protein